MFRPFQRKYTPAFFQRFINTLPQCNANYAQLTPLNWLQRNEIVYPDAEAVVHGFLSRTWSETNARCSRLATALISEFGISRGDVVAVMLSNTPEMVESHFGVPMTGGTLCSINTRLDASTVAYILSHSAPKLVLVDTEFSEVINDAIKMLKSNGDTVPTIIDICDIAGRGANANEGKIGEGTYEELLTSGSPDFLSTAPENEWDSLALNYTSGTTGKPKGVLSHHRGAYLAALGNMVSFGGMEPGPGVVRYLWTLPMFHCNGWTFPYTIAALGGTNVCLRKVSPDNIAEAFSSHSVTHLCGAPIVVRMAIDAIKQLPLTPVPPVKMMVAAAPPPASTIEEATKAGLNITHVYGLTESYGPATVCAWRRQWDELPSKKQAIIKARQGVCYATLDELTVLDEETNISVPADGQTLGEVAMRGNMVMKGYYKSPKATEEAFKSGYFLTGDLGVICPDGYIQIKDRKKDIIISGGENISTIEIENALYKHPSVAEAAVVGRPDKKWGETPCAFVRLKHDTEDINQEEIIKFLRKDLAGFKIPKTVIFGPLPTTSTGKIQKFKLRERVAALPSAK